MKLAFSSNAFRRWSIEQTIAILSEIGYDGIELMCDAPHAWPPDLRGEHIESMRRELARTGMEISNLNAFMMCAYRQPGTLKEGTFHWPSWIDPQAHVRKARIDHTMACVELAGKLGAKTVSTEPGGPLGERTRDAGYRLFAQGLEPVARRAVELGVTVLVEPEPELLIEKGQEYDEFEKGYVRFPGAGLNFDMGHFYCVGEDPASLIRRFGKRALHFHLEDIAATRVHHHLAPGDGAMDYRSIFGALRDVGYDGWVTIELYPFQEDAPRVAARAYNAIRPYVR